MYELLIRKNACPYPMLLVLGHFLFFGQWSEGSLANAQS